jgi:hypothetical protein
MKEKSVAKFRFDEFGFEVVVESCSGSQACG